MSCIPAAVFLQYSLKNGSARYKKALLSPSGLMSLLKKKTSTYRKFSRKRSRKKCTSNNHHTKNGTLAIAPLLFRVQQFRFQLSCRSLFFFVLMSYSDPRRKLNSTILLFQYSFFATVCTFFCVFFCFALLAEPPTYQNKAAVVDAVITCH